MIFAALGWALFVHGWLTLGYTVILFVFLDIKSHREEQWLKEKLSRYSDYQKHIYKLIPLLY
jgi:protein-S-isoprenylcysteine O-methyltransferase Ste14